MSADAPDTWAAWRWLLGEWDGEGTGAPGEGTGGFTFALELSDRVLVRRSVALYPEQDSRPASRHDDLVVLFDERGATHGLYVDSEGHVIHYDGDADPDQIVWTSSGDPPRYRFTYTRDGADRVKLRFEVARANDDYKTYVEGSAIRRR